jgi:hypothetical protein
MNAKVVAVIALVVLAIGGLYAYAAHQDAEEQRVIDGIYGSLVLQGRGAETSPEKIRQSIREFRTQTGAR